MVELGMYFRGVFGHTDRKNWDVQNRKNFRAPTRATFFFHSCPKSGKILIGCKISPVAQNDETVERI